MFKLLHLTLTFLVLLLPLRAQDSIPATSDPWKAIAFLEGTWQANAQGRAGVTTSGAYSFRMELDDHIMARHGVSYSTYKKSSTFDYQHGDLLYIYQDAPGQPLKAIYFDNEGHVIHYAVSTSDPTTAVFLSDPAQPGPQFQLVYQLKAGVMFGKFQMRSPGQATWNSYLEWSGRKQ